MTSSSDLHTPAISVYLDQWVWIRLTRVAYGRPEHPGDPDVLEAVWAAARGGVVFPLSATHYMETHKIRDPRQRRDLASVMAPISRVVTLKNASSLMRDQFLMAMHETFGRPAFRPSSTNVLGTGAWWALTGRETPLRLYSKNSGHVIEPTTAQARSLEAAWQVAEAMMLAGPDDATAEDLTKNFGYRPEEAYKATTSRLEWEQLFADLLLQNPVSRPELRVRVQVRELIHEHLHLFAGLMAEYNLSFSKHFPADPARPKAHRPEAVAFADRIPSLRVSTDLKTELFTDASREWTENDLHDIDA